MKVLILNGARNPKGQTATAAEALADGVREAGGEAEHVMLPTLAIERCRQCNDDGWGLCRAEGRCVIEDDFASLADRLAEADAAVFATPVYFSDLSESLRALLDRLRRICMHEVGKARVQGTPAVGVCVAGGGGGGAPECTMHLTKIVSRCGFDCIDMVPVRRQNLQAKLPLLAQTGTWLAGGR
ncbi:MAG: flavodoxin family protein [Planctomycetota bacterium]